MNGRVVVVGGGVIGMTVAWRVAQAGAEVTMLDPTPGQSASHAAAGMLAPVTEAHLGEERVLALNRHAAEQWPGFARELARASGRHIDRHTTGTVVAALDDDDRRDLDDLADRLVNLGLAVDRLRARDLRRREPALSPMVRRGLAVAGDHAVDNRQVVAALRRVIASAGVQHHPVAASGVEVVADRILGVTTADGKMPADTVVVAAGAWSARLDLPAEVRPPVRPVKGQILRLHDPGPRPLLQHLVRGRARGRGVYLVPRAHGEIVVGATVEDVGFDTTVTAGGTLDLLRAACDLVPGVRELALAETHAGLRPGTPDNAPLIGPTGIDGLVMATGHHRHGILQAPVTGDGIAHLLEHGSLPEHVAAFTPGRFAT